VESKYDWILIQNIVNLIYFYRRIQAEQGGQIGIVVHVDWFEPLSNSVADKLAAERAQSFSMNW